MTCGEIIGIDVSSARFLKCTLCAGDDKPPKDRTVQYEELRHVSTPVYLSLVILASTGIIMACCFLGLNIHFRRHR